MKTERKTRFGLRLHVFTCDRMGCHRQSAAHPGLFPRGWTIAEGGLHFCERHPVTSAPAPRKAVA